MELFKRKISFLGLELGNGKMEKKDKGKAKIIHPRKIVFLMSISSEDEQTEKLMSQAIKADKIHSSRKLPASITGLDTVLRYYNPAYTPGTNSRHTLRPCLQPVLDRFTEFEQMVSQKICTEFPLVLYELQLRLMMIALNEEKFKGVTVVERTDDNGDGTCLLLL
ncbi:hypothetical protein L1987_09707 [Smallanthus sonchifolius]|uniref:Uncharacterized protein n=1 Tax=Smallanthus sonchifolius TaxID=185202 RepID=A0ACB9JQ39_9ASTR|nr:hypothetical protein L1987_09707 [Smallanthus sonchifolius]